MKSSARPVPARLPARERDGKEHVKSRTIALVIAIGLIAGCATVKGKTGRAEIEGTGKGGAIVATMYPSQTLTVSIDCHPETAYEFASNPENLPRWAKGLGRSVKKQGADWIVDTPQGPVKVRIADKNRLGVLDHFVTTPSGVEVYVPIRVLPNGSGSEVLFTLFRLPDVSDEKYAEDMKLVERDLRTLKEILER